MRLARMRPLPGSWFPSTQFQVATEGGGIGCTALLSLLWLLWWPLQSPRSLDRLLCHEAYFILVGNRNALCQYAVHQRLDTARQRDKRGRVQRCLHSACSIRS